MKFWNWRPTVTSSDHKCSFLELGCLAEDQTWLFAVMTLPVRLAIDSSASVCMDGKGMIGKGMIAESARAAGLGFDESLTPNRCPGVGTKLAAGASRERR